MSCHCSINRYHHVYYVCLHSKEIGHVHVCFLILTGQHTNSQCHCYNYCHCHYLIILYSLQHYHQNSWQNHALMMTPFYTSCDLNLIEVVVLQCDWTDLLGYILQLHITILQSSPQHNIYIYIYIHNVKLSQTTQLTATLPQLMLLLNYQLNLHSYTAEN